MVNVRCHPLPAPWNCCQGPPGLTVLRFGPGVPTNGRNAGLCFCAGRRVFPPEPPVEITVWPERRGDVKGAPVFGAAKRTLDVEHRSGIHLNFDGRLGGNTLPLVSSEPR